MVIFSYTDGQINEGLFQKAGLDKPSLAIDFRDGFASSGVTMGAVTYGAINVSGATVTSSCISSVSTSGSVMTVNLLTCGTSGTQEAINNARFKLYFRPTLSNSRDIEYDVYVHVVNPTYSPE